MAMHLVSTRNRNKVTNGHFKGDPHQVLLSKVL
jgi:hypothetical protein